MVATRLALLSLAASSNAMFSPFRGGECEVPGKYATDVFLTVSQMLARVDLIDALISPMGLLQLHRQQHHR